MKSNNCNFLVLDLSTPYFNKSQQLIERDSIGLNKEKAIDTNVTSNSKSKIEKQKQYCSLLQTKEKTFLNLEEIMTLKNETNKVFLQNFKVFREFLQTKKATNTNHRIKTFVLTDKDQQLSFYISKRLSKVFDLEYFSSRLISDIAFNGIIILLGSANTNSNHSKKESSEHSKYMNYLSSCILHIQEYFKQLSVNNIVLCYEGGSGNTETVTEVPGIKQVLEYRVIRSDSDAVFSSQQIKKLFGIVKDNHEYRLNINPLSKTQFNYVNNFEKNETKTKKKDFIVKEVRGSAEGEQRREKAKEYSDQASKKYFQKTQKIIPNKKSNDNDKLNQQNKNSESGLTRNSDINILKPMYDSINKESNLNNKSISNQGREKTLLPNSIYSKFKENTSFQVRRSYFKIFATKNKKPKKRVKKLSTLNHNKVEPNFQALEEPESFIEYTKEKVNKIEKEEHSFYIDSQFSNIVKMGTSMVNNYYLIGSSRGALIKANILFEIIDIYDFRSNIEDYIDKYSKISPQSNSFINSNWISSTSTLDNPIPENFALVSPFSLAFTCFKNKILLFRSQQDSSQYKFSNIGSHDCLTSIRVLSELYLASLSDFACIKVFNMQKKQEIKYYKMYSMTQPRSCFFELNLEYFVYVDSESTKIFDINQDKIIENYRNAFPVVYFTKINPLLNVFINIHIDSSYSLLALDYTKNKVYLNSHFYYRQPFCFRDSEEFSFRVDRKISHGYVHSEQVFLVSNGKYVIVNHFYFEDFIPKLKFLCIIDSGKAVGGWVLEKTFMIVLGENYFKEREHLDFATLLFDKGEDEDKAEEKGKRVNGEKKEVK